MSTEVVDRLYEVCYKLLDPIGEDFSGIWCSFPVSKAQVDVEPCNISKISIVEVKRNGIGGLCLCLDYTSDVLKCNAMATEWVWSSNSTGDQPDINKPASSEEMTRASDFIEDLLANLDANGHEIKSFAGRNSLFEYFGVDIQDAEKPFCGTR